MDIVVRPAVADDLPALLPLLRGYSDFYEASPDEGALLAMASAFCADPDGQGRQLLAEADAGELVGFATVLWSWDTTTGTRLAVMEDLFVREGPAGEGRPEAPRRLQGLARDHGCAADVGDVAGQRARPAPVRPRPSADVARLPAVHHLREPAAGWSPRCPPPRGIRCPPCRVHSSSRPTSRSRPSSASRLQNPQMLRVHLGGDVLATKGAMIAYQGQIRFDHEKSGTMAKLLKKVVTGEDVSLMRVSGEGDVFFAAEAGFVFLIELGATRCRSTRATCSRSTPRSTGTSSACRAQA